MPVRIDSDFAAYIHCAQPTPEDRPNSKLEPPNDRLGHSQFNIFLPLKPGLPGHIPCRDNDLSQDIVLLVRYLKSKSRFTDILEKVNYFKISQNGIKDI